MKKHFWGFHLIEIIIFINIIGIMSLFVYPLYKAHVIHAKRLIAVTFLGTLSIAMEEYHFNHHTYQGASLSLPRELSTRDYEFSLMNESAQSYLLLAKPIGDQADHDKACATLTLNELGTQAITGSGDVKACWS